MRVVIISGYFNPLHTGHLDYIEAAKKLGDKLIVIVNNDRQVGLKESVPFMDEIDRCRIVQSIGVVSSAVLSVDEDSTVCKSVKAEYDKHCNDPFIYDIIFANGGDRKEGGVPEDEVCERLGIKLVYNVGGEKTQSSSGLIGKANLDDIVRKNQGRGTC